MPDYVPIFLLCDRVLHKQTHTILIEVDHNNICYLLNGLYFILVIINCAVPAA